MADNVINVLDCVIESANTGYTPCTFSPGYMKMAIHVPKGTYLTNELVTIAKLQLMCRQNSPAARSYPLAQFLNIEDQSQAAGTQTFNYGTAVTTNDGTPKWMFQILDGNICTYKAMRKFSKAQSRFDVYFVTIGTDGNEYLMGYESTATIADVVTQVIRPFTMEEIFVPIWSPANSGAIPKYTISYTFGSTRQYSDLLAFAKLDGEAITGISGLQDVVLTADPAGIDDDTFGVTAITKCDGANLGDIYGDTLADPDAWTAKNAVTGNAITITSVAWNSTSKQYELLLSSVDADYPAVNGDIYLNLAAPIDLFTFASVLYEAAKITVQANT